MKTVYNFKTVLKCFKIKILQNVEDSLKLSAIKNITNTNSYTKRKYSCLTAVTLNLTQFNFYFYVKINKLFTTAYNFSLILIYKN